MLEILRPFIFPTHLELRFVIKTLCSGLLALWIALQMDLNHPHWSMVTAVGIAQLDTDSVIKKGLARLIGTAVGAIMAVIITAISIQSPWLFLLITAAWLGLTTAVSNWIHSVWSYACVLSGYTVSIITSQSLYNPPEVFFYAVARTTEISIGIICVTIISAIFWPTKPSKQNTVTPTATKLTRSLNYKNSLFYGTRAALSFLSIAVFWLITGWPAAGNALCMTAGVVSLFANQDKATLIAKGVLLGVIYSSIPTFIVSQIILPQSNSFALLGVALSIPLFFGLLGMTAKPTMVKSLAFSVFFIAGVAPNNYQLIGLSDFINNTLALVIGSAFSAIIFSLIGSKSSA